MQSDQLASARQQATIGLQSSYLPP